MKREEPKPVDPATLHVIRLTEKVVALLADSLSKAEDQNEWVYKSVGAETKEQRAFYTHRIPKFLASIRGTEPMKSDLAFLIRAAHRHGIKLWMVEVEEDSDESNYC